MSCSIFETLDFANQAFIELRQSLNLELSHFYQMLQLYYIHRDDRAVSMHFEESMLILLHVLILDNAHVTLQRAL